MATAEKKPLLDKGEQETGLLDGMELKNPVSEFRVFADRIVTNFGWHFALILASAYVGVKGFVFSCISIGQVPYYKDFMGLPAERYQSLKTVASTPWAMKALLGALSDCWPILGYHKRYYIVMTGIIGCIALLTISVLPASAPGELAAAMFFFVQLYIATTDLLCEGKYAEKMREKPHTGADLVSWVWGLVQFGGLLGAAVAGPVAESGNPRLIFWICVPFALQMFVPLLKGWLPEVKVPEGQRDFRWDKLQAQPQLFQLGFFVAIGAFVLAVVGEVGSTLVQLVCSLLVSVAACVLAHLWLPPVLAKANLYMFLAQVLYIQVDGASTYFFIATKEQYPDGPHFSNVYYFTYTAIVGALAGMFGVGVFQGILSKGNFRTAFWATTVVQCAASFVDVMLVKRWNIALGIPDKLFFMLGDAMIGTIIGMMNFMPAVVLTSKVCPKGLEALVYALLAGFQNFGGTVSSYLGAYLTQVAGIQTDADKLPWNFDALPMLLIVCHMLLPLLAVPLTFILIPDANMTDELEFAELEADADEGEIEAPEGLKKVIPE